MRQHLQVLFTASARLEFLAIYGNEGLQWTAIALQSQAVFCGEDPDPTQAGIHGFIGIIAKEFSQWKFRLLDMASPVM